MREMFVLVGLIDLGVESKGFAIVKERFAEITLSLLLDGPLVMFYG